jgi:galactose oxidase-like protein
MPPRLRLAFYKPLVAGGALLLLGCGGPLSPSEELHVHTAAVGVSVTGSMASQLHLHTATLLPSGEVFVAGGHEDSGGPESAELYSPVSGTWRPAAKPLHAHASHTATLLPSGKVLLAGGISSTVASVAELYDPVTDSWQCPDCGVVTRGEVPAHARSALERCIRNAVMYRKTSFGTQSAEGSRFVERIFTATTTPSSCKAVTRSPS